MRATWYTVASDGSVGNILGNDFLPTGILCPIAQWCMANGETVLEEQDAVTIRLAPDRVRMLLEDTRGFLADGCSIDSMLKRFRILLDKPGSYRDTGSLDRKDWVAALHALESLGNCRTLETRILTNGYTTNGHD